MTEAISSTALITPSFRGDFARCALLCKSIDAFVTGSWHHYIAVEEQDYVMFRSFNSARRTVLKIKDILPGWLHHLGIIPFSNQRSLWFSFRTGWLIGWHIQQLVKIQMALKVQDACLLYCDSDVMFVRPFDVSALQHDYKYRFYRSDVAASRETITNPNYLIRASQVLGLGDDPFPSPTYVDNLVTWYRPAVQAMCAYLEKTTGKSWIAALGRNIVFSEYSIYGLFVDRLSTQKHDVFATGVSLCKTAWRGREWNGDILTEFFDTLSPDHVAVGFQSFLGVDIAALSKQLDRAIAAAHDMTA